MGRLQRPDRCSQYWSRRPVGGDRLMAWAIRMPIRDEHERLDAQSINELPQLLEDREDRLIVEEILRSCRAYPTFKTVGNVAEGLGLLTREELRVGLDAVRKRVGLKDVATTEWEESVKFRGRRRDLDPSAPGPRVVFTPTGWRDLDELEAADAREQNLARIAAGREEARRQEAAAALAERNELERARDERRRRETPPGFAS